MKTLSTYRVNQPTTSDGHSMSITTTIFGTEEEVEYRRKGGVVKPMNEFFLEVILFVFGVFFGLLLLCLCVY